MKRWFALGMMICMVMATAGCTRMVIPINLLPMLLIENPAPMPNSSIEAPPQPQIAGPEPRLQSLTEPAVPLAQLDFNQPQPKS